MILKLCAGKNRCTAEEKQRDGDDYKFVVFPRRAFIFRSSTPTMRCGFGLLAGHSAFLPESGVYER